MKHSLPTALAFALAVGFTAAAAIAQETASSDAASARTPAADTERDDFVSAAQRIEKRY